MKFRYSIPGLFLLFLLFLLLVHLFGLQAAEWLMYIPIGIFVYRRRGKIKNAYYHVRDYVLGEKAEPTKPARKAPATRTTPGSPDKATPTVPVRRTPTTGSGRHASTERKPGQLSPFGGTVKITVFDPNAPKK